ncbi:DUF1652 domain-containing protein [Pseudomonas sp. HR96]|uniref:DUF1652 domain-containing protein n=1 Tax=Pseudomonas sp. HR96 TaxID=1027966 RepID=UPI002A75D81D|nr:DUF1652 domain-containing protein [Pseudomonas sp. HR96]WPP01847.1 DUF1652 domain-containing protein [Pseudomonas sp. HR96]
MLPIGLSALELRNIVECAFLPLHCTCSTADNATLSVDISDPQTGKVHLLKTGIAPERLASSRGICNLIAELRTELTAEQAALVEPVTHAQRQVRYA